MDADQLTWDELMDAGWIGKPVWSASRREWLLVCDSALDNRSWLDLTDACGKIHHLGPHDLKDWKIYKEKKA